MLEKDVGTESEDSVCESEVENDMFWETALCSTYQLPPSAIHLGMHLGVK